jgi:outer membrane protein OmpA-like peptidoglycan-associated protein/outer membrane protein W
MKLRLALAAATCLALPLAAHAQPVTGPYVSLEGGTSIANPGGFENRTAGTSGKITYKNSYAAATAVGYGFGDGFRVELNADFNRNTVHKFSYNGGGAALASGGLNTYGPMVNALYDIDVGLPIFPYVGAGVGYQWQKFVNPARSTFDGVGGTRGSFAYNIIAGVAYPLPGVPGLSLTGEYKFTQLVESRNYHDYDAAPAGTWIHIGQDSSHTFLLGLRYQIFNPPPAPPPAPPVAAAPPPPAPLPARTFLVFFDWDKYNLTPRATEIISEAASDSKTSSVTTLDVSGYTDTSGTPDYNMGLSERRAKSVAAQLETDGVPASEIEIHAYGETHLLVATGPGVREPQNRRVEIVLH